MRAVLEGRAPADADVSHAEGVLRLLGLSPAAAATVAGRPFPSIDERPLAQRSDQATTSAIGGPY
jgi:hypothetical protein